MSGVDAACKWCALARADLRRAIYRANGQVMRGGHADTRDIQRLKTQAEACTHCGGTGRVPGRPLSPGRAPTIKQPQAKPAKPASSFDPAAVAAALAASAEEVQKARRSVREARPVTGYCHGCDRQIVWGRLFCGPCAADRDSGGIKRSSA